MKTITTKKTYLIEGKIIPKGTKICLKEEDEALDTYVPPVESSDTTPNSYDIEALRRARKLRRMKKAEDEGEKEDETSAEENSEVEALHRMRKLRRMRKLHRMDDSMCEEDEPTDIVAIRRARKLRKIDNPMCEEDDDIFENDENPTPTPSMARRFRRAEEPTTDVEVLRKMRKIRQLRRMKKAEDDCEDC